MKNKLNNKGFAVSTVVYAILLLLVILMFIILLLYRNTYRNQKQFSVDVQDELNDHLKDDLTPPDITSPTCEIKSTPNGDGTYTLTISSTSEDLDYVNGAFSFDGVNYSNKNTTIKKPNDCEGELCTYKGYTKDIAGHVTEDKCEIQVTFDKTPPTCELKYENSKLVIVKTSAQDETVTYSFDDVTYNSTNTLETTTPKTYTGYIKDNANNVGRCYATLNEFTATFSLENDYSERISIPSSEITKDCLTIGTSCDITTPRLAVTSTSSYTYTAKGWSTTKNSTTASVNAESNLSINRDVTYYPVIKREYSDDGGSDDGGSVGGGNEKCVIKSSCTGVGQTYDYTVYTCEECYNGSYCLGCRKTGCSDNGGMNCNTGEWE